MTTMQATLLVVGLMIVSGGFLWLAKWRILRWVLKQNPISRFLSEIMHSALRDEAPVIDPQSGALTMRVGDASCKLVIDYDAVTTYVLLLDEGAKITIATDGAYNATYKDGTPSRVWGWLVGVWFNALLDFCKLGEEALTRHSK